MAASRQALGIPASPGVSWPGSLWDRALHTTDQLPLLHLTLVPTETRIKW